MKGMKKAAAWMIAAALSFSMASAALAGTDTVTSVPDTKTATVTGTYQAGSAADTVYKVDIEWGSMAFVYTDGAQGSWDPVTHTYGAAAAGSWQPEDTLNGGKITVTNHSNAAIQAELAFDPATAYQGTISGTFTENSGTADDGTLSLATAVGTAVESAPSETAKLGLNGALTAGTSAATIGEVTVQINSAD